MNLQLVDSRRYRMIKDGRKIAGPVVYWMQRDQRVHHNHALLFAQQKALEIGQPLAVLFCLTPDYLGATWRQYAFMLRSLEMVEKELASLHLPFFILSGQPKAAIPTFLKNNNVALLVTDFSPLRLKRQWIRDVSKRADIPFYEVDTHNIVPVWEASDKQEYAAYTLRPKIIGKLGEFLTPIPKIKKHPLAWGKKYPATNWSGIYRNLKVDRSVAVINAWTPGEKQALKVMKSFFEKRLVDYYEKRNNPVFDIQSDLSPYLHFGQIAAQQVALEAQRFDKNLKSQESFVEELVVRRELADNFCYYNDRYDSFDGFPRWAQKTLREHSHDPREYLYPVEQLEAAQTHDLLWNAAQKQMVLTGKMHGYMRMYWAKKILAWSSSPEEAFQTALYLNDRFELDGRDPNGYTGLAWSIGGVHDRPWFDRPVFGQVRYMSYEGCQRKFPVKAYIEKIERLEKSGL